MASLLVKSEQMPLQINLSAIATMSKLSDRFPLITIKLSGRPNLCY
ncbi:hypothetical protein [Aliterella atlantica]|nr:hypothetical protein [Aliterella atlantica]